jgi:uncharacterized membrane protein
MAGMIADYWNWPGGMMGGWYGGAWPQFMWFMAVYWLISIVFMIWALIKIAGSKKDAGYKLIWAGVVVFLGILGVLIYYLIENMHETGKDHGNDGSDDGARKSHEGARRR